jgi:uncharacterized membrane protein YqiK
VIAVLIVGLFRWLYVKVPANMAFIRTGLGGWKAVTDAGAFVLPIVHNIQWLSLETFKIEVVRSNRDAFILKDRYRVDIGAEFYVKILSDSDMVEAASRSLGDKSFSADGIKALVEEKLISAMRSAAAQMELVELHENRSDFARRVKELVTEPLAQNGLGIEDVALFSLDQTDKSQLDPNNIFDAQGLRQITAQTSTRMQERRGSRAAEARARPRAVLRGGRAGAPDREPPHRAAFRGRALSLRPGSPDPRSGNRQGPAGARGRAGARGVPPREGA